MSLGSAAGRELLRSFQLTSAQKREVWEAWVVAEEGTERCALRASAEGQKRGNTGAGLLLTMIRAGEHLIEADQGAPRVTGIKFVRGSHSGRYVSDPTGTDRLPAGYDLSSRAGIARDKEAREPLGECP